jgi:3-hydroxyisobutyrate dehydrogenase
MERIGVIGLGRMGSAIARRYAAQGHAVTGWTRSGRGLPEIGQAGDLAALVADADMLILSLFDDAAVAETLDRLLACDIAGRLIADTSTVVPTLLTDRAAALAARGAEVVDAPISGGPDLVAAGTCGIFIGGEAAAAARATAAFAPLTGRIFHVGPLGTGLVMKTINNAMLQVYFAGLADLLPLARRAGLPLRTTMTILNGGPAGVPMLHDRMAKVLGEDTSTGFSIAAVAKDNDVFQRVARSHGVVPGMLSLAARGQQAAIGAGLGDADIAALLAAAYDS